MFFSRGVIFENYIEKLRLLKKIKKNPLQKFAKDF